MKKYFLVIVFLVIAMFVVWKFFFQKKKEPNAAKPQAIAVNSSVFNQSLKLATDFYTQMTESFVNWDSSGVNRNAAGFLQALDSLRTDELKKDSAIYVTVISHIDIARTETRSIIDDPDWKEKRGSLNVLSQNFYDLLRSVQYDVDRIYYQECPMAFGEDTYGYWVSTTKPIRNPYLGTSDPEYGRKMLACGSTKDSLKFYGRK